MLSLLPYPTLPLLWVGSAALWQRLEEDPAELLAKQLPNHPPYLQIKERSQNLRRVQGRSFHDLIDVSELVRAEQLIFFSLAFSEAAKADRFSFGIALRKQGKFLWLPYRFGLCTL